MQQRMRQALCFGIHDYQRQKSLARRVSIASGEANSAILETVRIDGRTDAKSCMQSCNAFVRFGLHEPVHERVQKRRRFLEQNGVLVITHGQ